MPGKTKHLGIQNELKPKKNWSKFGGFVTMINISIAQAATCILQRRVALEYSPNTVIVCLGLRGAS